MERVRRDCPELFIPPSSQNILMTAKTSDYQLKGKEMGLHHMAGTKIQAG